jgi:NADPH:quinone reductase-like Zn-dependent oxidoreductase
VFGGASGAFGEYVTVRENGAVALKPTNMTFEQAAAAPIAAITALQALRDKGKVHAGQKVLINGASGGVGTFAVQLAKVYGADVTAVCSTRNGPLVLSIGADHVIDYTKEDFTLRPERYDQADLQLLRELMQAGKITSVIDRRYPLAQTADAIRYLELGHARGKVIITVEGQHGHPPHAQ